MIDNEIHVGVRVSLHVGNAPALLSKPSLLQSKFSYFPDRRVLPVMCLIEATEDLIYFLEFESLSDP